MTILIPLKTDRLRIVFMGSDAIALPMLNWLIEEGATHAELVAVFTQPDRAVGRGQKVVANAIKQWAQARGLPVHQPEKLTSDARATLAGYAADVALVMAYGHILREAFIDTPRLGTLNLHASLLPKYRGASPIQSAIANGETETGVALMRIVRALDAGPVADVERVPIAPRDTALDVEAKLAAACVPLVARGLPALAGGNLHFVEQDHPAATFCRRLVKTDGGLDFASPAAELAARVNGLFPWPSVRVVVQGQDVKLGLAESSPTQPDAVAGTVLGLNTGALEVATGQGTLRLLQLQRPGGRMMPATDFLRGFPVDTGSVLPSAPMPELVRQEST